MMLAESMRAIMILTALQSKISSGKRKKKKSQCPMYKFHLVFVTNPPVVQRNFRINELYNNIVAKMSLVLRFEQQRSNYVWEQALLIQGLKDALSTQPIEMQWQQIIEKSQLAKVIATTYHQILLSDIVNVDINGRMRTFQIPLMTEFVSLPPRQVEVLPGSTLSSVSPFTAVSDDSEIQHEKEEMMVHFALLLLDDTETIVKDIGAEKDSLIDSFIRVIKPTESLTQLSAMSELDINEVRSFAKHLIFWRRAKAVLPVSYRNTYIVSPLAPMQNIYQDSMIFKQTFFAMPPLTDLLSHLSSVHSRPKALKYIIPSKDHRGLYVDAIAWLLKYGYVCQLHSFFWVKITKEVKIKVAEQLEIESKKRKHKRQEQQQQQQLGGHNRDSSREIDPDLAQFLTNSENENDSNEEAMYGSSSESESELNNSKNKHVRNTDNTMRHSHRGDSKNLSSRSNTNPNILNHGLSMSMGSTAAARSNSSVTATGGQTKSGFANGFNNNVSGRKLAVQFEEEEEEDTILVDPESATALERKWIAACVDGKPPEVTNLFYKLLKYMNGKWALDMFLLKEGVSRHDIKKMIEAMGEHIVVGKHCTDKISLQDHSTNSVPLIKTDSFYRQLIQTTLYNHRLDTTYKMKMNPKIPTNIQLTPQQQIQQQMLLRANDRYQYRIKKLMNAHTLYVAVLFMFGVLQFIGLAFFTRGFLLSRQVLSDQATCLSQQGSEQCFQPQHFNKTLMLVIDALRFDFVIPVNESDQGFHTNYHNNFPVLHRLFEEQPENSLLLKFIADPPTTTSQRLKGLTTGSLPTIIDAGSNFDADTIDEDNLISQFHQHGKKVAFVGDDTWNALFGPFLHPNLTFPYDSFNVGDLHTVDNGVTEHLFPMLSGELGDWDMLIGHFLGVDHCGHRFGPEHFAMKDKLSQMNDVIERVIEELDDDTLLVLYGDHGMDPLGNHGGETQDEID
ncbi:unnamed protein product [Ambrosiozyma monospora]|uniref:Nitrogen permease regulator 3 n=1 Tax=Ambrosiozyma monospora TaxID=43982 RepID=A0A9W7DGK4_AMBMO|nr:unnamed protein product [Ambrosiozyma monospora]